MLWWVDKSDCVLAYVFVCVCVCVYWGLIVHASVFECECVLTLLVRVVRVRVRVGVLPISTYVKEVVKENWRRGEIILVKIWKTSFSKLSAREELLPSATSKIVSTFKFSTT